MKKIDLVGKVFGRLTVIKQCIGWGKKKIVSWECLCECGKTHSVNGEALRYGLTRSCGCLAIEQLIDRSLTHGATRGYKESREYKSWSHAKSRCYNINDPKYPIYGGRGIRMYEGWVNSPDDFLQYMGKRPPKHTLDRIDTNGNYEPSNCRWALPRQQARNTRVNVWITHNGKTMVEADWAKEFGLDKRLFNAKWKREMDIQSIEKYARSKNAFFV